MHLLKECDGTFLVSNAEPWLPIIHTWNSDEQGDLVLDSFVVDEIIPKLNTQTAFEFGLCLINFVMYDKDGADKILDDRYVKFIKENVGIVSLLHS